MERGHILRGSVRQCDSGYVAGRDNMDLPYAAVVIELAKRSVERVGVLCGLSDSRHDGGHVS